MATQEEMIARRDALQAALDSGVQEVSSGDGRTVYRSTAEMEKALAQLNQRIGLSAPVSRIVFSTTKGL